MTDDDSAPGASGDSADAESGDPASAESGDSGVGERTDPIDAESVDSVDAASVDADPVDSVDAESVDPATDEPIDVGPGATAAADDESAPMSSLAERVAERRAERAGDADDAFDELFEREEVGEIDGEKLLARLDGEEATGDAADSRTVREVDKHRYCHQCEHFSGPPAVECTNEGTEILELPTLSTFRLAGCPVVREEDELNDRS